MDITKTATTSRTARHLVAAVALPLAAMCGLVAYLLIVQDRLPLEVATHWGVNGEANGFTSRATLPWLAGGISLVMVVPFIIMALVYSPKSFMPSAFKGLPLAMTVFIGTLVAASTWRQLDGAAESLPLWLPVAAIAVGSVGGIIGTLVAGKPPAAPATSDPAPADAERFPLAEGQTAVWSGRTPVGKALPLLLTFFVVVNGLVAAFTSWWQLVIVAVVAVVLIASSSFSVTAGPAGVRVAGLLGYPRITVPLPEITEANIGSVSARSYGGWGLRATRGNTAVLTRSGPALSLTRTDGAMLHVALDDPEKPAALLSTLLDRRA